MALTIGACSDGSVDTESTTTTAASGTDDVATTTTAESGAEETTTTTGSGSDRYGGSLTIGVRREAGELDIHKPTIGTTRQYARALYNALFAVETDGTVAGELVETWETPDPTTYVFHLRQGVTFHDGTDWNAEALKSNFERIMDPDEQAFYRTQLGGITNIEIVDDHTVELTLSEPDATLPARLSDRAGWMVSPTAVELWGDEYATHPVGTGPFELVEWVKDDHLTLRRFDNYWQTDESGNQLPYLDELIFRPITDLTVLFAGVRAGEIDLIETILPDDVATARDDENLVVVEGPGQIWRMGLNNTAPPFDNVNLRRAVAYAIDRAAIHEGIFQGLGSPGEYLIRPGNWALDPDGEFYNFDPARVEEELATGGFPDGFAFELIVNNVTNDMQVGEAIQAQLAAFGIQVELVPLQSSAAAERRIAGDYDASISQSPPSADPDQEVALFMQSDSTVNSSGYANAQVDALLAEARGIPDAAERAPLYHEVQAIILAESPDVYLLNAADLKVHRTNVQGYEPAFDSFIRVAGLWLEG
jgi:peptide/nickel transport system substrate-binding protein